jgi:hypothetical protein
MTTISSHALHPRTPQAIKASRSWSIRALEVAGSAMDESPSDPACGACAQAKSVAFYNLGMLSEVSVECGTWAGMADPSDRLVARDGRPADDHALDRGRFRGCAPAIQVRGGERQDDRLQRGATRSRTGHQQGAEFQRGRPEYNRGKAWSSVIDNDLPQDLHEEVEYVIHYIHDALSAGYWCIQYVQLKKGERKCPCPPDPRPHSGAAQQRSRKPASKTPMARRDGG